VKIFAAVARLVSCLTVLSLLAAGQPQAANSTQPAHQPASPPSPAGSAPAQPAANPAGCQWSYYPISGGHLQPEQLLFNDPDNTPTVNLSTGNLFKGKPAALASLASTGSTDFNGDGKTDVFRTFERGDGSQQWQYSSGGTGAWQDLAIGPAEAPAAQLGFGNFDSNSATDVFANTYLFPTYTWQYSPGGSTSFVPLHTTNYFADRLALGDFNGDGVTDVFTASAHNNTEQWGYFPGGSGSLVNIAHSDIDPALLRFGDFNGDHVTDVFAATQQSDGSTQWLYSRGGATSYSDLITTTVPYSMLQFGDFNGDGKTDVLTPLPQADGGLQAIMWPGGLGPSVNLGHIPAPAPALRVGDFNGDGTSDLLALRCGMGGPLKSGPLQTLATAGYKTFARSMIGNLNGDGWPDVILVSTCQNLNVFGNCATHHYQVSAILGAAAYANTLVGPQTLSTADFQYARTLAGDFNGDGRTDLVIVQPGFPTVMITVGLSNGDGTFALGTQQFFSGENWNALNPLIGDFNGDGKTDLAFTSVCNTVALRAGSCTNGTNNIVRVATAGVGGLFSMGARQTLGAATGWDSYYAFAGDFNGDGKTDLVFNSTCRGPSPAVCTDPAGDNNYVYTALSNGSGSFTLGALQDFGPGWSDFPNSANLVGDINGDGRADLVWDSNYQAAGPTNNHLVVVGLANPDGTLALGSTLNFGSAWAGYLSLADLNHDGKADLLWNDAPLGSTDVDNFAATLSTGNGTFQSPITGAVYTSPGYFQMPTSEGLRQVPTQLTLISNNQNPISSALFVVNVWLSQSLYLPLAQK